MPLELDGFQSWVTCGGKEITCHGIEKSEDGKEVTCWIASEERKKFSIKWTRPAQLARTAMRGKVQVDNILCRGIVMQGSNTPGCVYSRDGFTTSCTTVKPFMFASLKTTGAFTCISP
ncbi:hypothetical protein FIBSPDRAFT_873840 [Athelia psychrophila]|uniref:Uncharacterized protein n=1 Tax=Athelia psychrophila TaxID=1759441 RepID=A0A165Y5N1_9AGAM|nr:hypothetical protein FIBSPDRAFT_873840 [Fibularhizoctonia sp. CBS 109695]